MMMDIRLFRMKTGDVKCFKKPEEETAILLLQGKLTLCWAGQEKQVSRGKTCGQKGCGACMCAGIRKFPYRRIPMMWKFWYSLRIIIAIFRQNFTRPADIPWEERCRGKYGDTAKRKVTTIFDYETAPYSNMVLGEIMNDPGNWCGYLQRIAIPSRSFTISSLSGRKEFGASFVGEDVYYIKDGSFSAIPGGKTHPQSAGAGISHVYHLDDPAF